MPTTFRLTVISIAASLLVAACGGGGSSGSTASQNASGGTTTAGAGSADTGTGSGGTTTGGTTGTGTTTGGTTTGGQTAQLPAAVATDASTVMVCADGPTYQCSGPVLRTDNGVILSSSGVQVYGKSTSDLLANNANVTTATGLALASGGSAEMRISKDANLIASNPALILRNLGISWDGRTERPPIIETFNPAQGRTLLSANGAVTNVALPDSSDLTFYDFATKGQDATQANYANNRYFPRANNPSRCPAGTPTASCLSVETQGPLFTAGDWRIGGTNPDLTVADRLHEDGDVHAGNGTPGPNGSVTILPGGSGVGVPFPGSKGFREFQNFSFRYGNLAKWTTQDGVNIVEWNATNEHNQIRRGVISYGDVTPPTAIPATGTATYAGTVRAWYAPDKNTDANPFIGNATMTVDFSSRKVTIAVQNMRTDDAAATPIPVTFQATAWMGASGSNVANYLTGTVDAGGGFKGGISGRYFGPVAAGSGPAEAGSTFSLENPTTGQTIIGGFIALKQ